MAYTSQAGHRSHHANVRLLVNGDAMWLKNHAVQRLGGGRLERWGLSLWSKLQISALQSRKDQQVVSLLKQVRRERTSLLSAFEAYNIYSLALSMSRLPGAMAEVGVFQGASARLICEAKGDKTLRLFDTFEGLPQGCDKDNGVHRTGMYACSLESVSEYLSDYPQVEYYQGLFPDSASDTPDGEYCFVHFDVDLYEGTLACLEYFYPRMVPGGIMVSHDYGLLAGVEAAFTEFFSDKPEPVIDMPTTQCMVVKLG